MKARCDNPRNDFYYRYGGRGITYCDKWKTFEGFLEDMQEGYFLGYSLERRDFNLGYTLSNCKWILPKDQAKNRGIASNNTSGLTGCDVYYNRIGVPYVRSRWTDQEGKLRSKYFNMNTFGEEAWSLAEEYREQNLKEMGYGENHGK
jgi:hypothetical protein